MLTLLDGSSVVDDDGEIVVKESEDSLADYVQSGLAGWLGWVYRPTVASG